MPKCIKCRNCYTPKNDKDICRYDHWDRSADDFVFRARDFVKYVNIQRHCSDFSEYSEYSDND